MPTLTEVAKRAGVSTATVSKVLSNTPYFTEETRQKVMEAVEEIGYIPNLAARALSTGKTHIIGVVFPYIFDTVFSDPLVMEILQGVEAVCREQGCSVLLSTPRIDDGEIENNYLQLVRSGYLDGIIALDYVPVASVIEPANAYDVTAVCIGYDTHTHYVRRDDYDGGYRLMQHVLELEHRHIGVICPPQNLNSPVNERLNGMRDAAQAHGLDFAALPTASGNYSVDSGATGAQHLLQQHPEITAIICVNDRMAIGAIQYLQSAGYTVPDDVTVVGYDNIAMSQFISPTITTINQHATDLGQRAAHMLFDVLNGKDVQPITLPPELIVRQSSGKPRTGPLP
ncbi:MAG: LacI family DNA-binding transcriptional regulator [Chloroflexota bacterium]